MNRLVTRSTSNFGSIPAFVARKCCQTSVCRPISSSAFLEKGPISDRSNLKLDTIETRERNQLLRAIQENEQLRNVMAYSLAMASLEGNRFPPLIRPLNEREKNQIRISKLQRRHMSSPVSPVIPQ
ncbi:hypothetical protein IV203_010805 [Nitzschia inconspicua]|uniref:Uncharacterized protein n=1 Tax=Nitzschia inconspicua TaxID=303405 RepID=A0A9K3PL35_9STRA|nr:hypothetical protein IV203_010805 [Nitzschia inconspicua]